MVIVVGFLWTIDFLKTNVAMIATDVARVVDNFWSWFLYTVLMITFWGGQAAMHCVFIVYFLKILSVGFLPGEIYRLVHAWTILIILGIPCHFSSNFLVSGVLSGQASKGSEPERDVCGHPRLHSACPQSLWQGALGFHQLNRTLQWWTCVYMFCLLHRFGCGCGRSLMTEEFCEEFDSAWCIWHRWESPQARYQDFPCESKMFKNISRHAG